MNAKIFWVHPARYELKTLLSSKGYSISLTTQPLSLLEFHVLYNFELCFRFWTWVDPATDSSSSAGKCWLKREAAINSEQLLYQNCVLSNKLIIFFQTWKSARVGSRDQSTAQCATKLDPGIQKNEIYATLVEKLHFVRILLWRSMSISVRNHCIY